MTWAAFISWLLTAGGGFVLLLLWLRHGGMQQREGRQIRPPLILAHFGLAATGLVLWIVYLATDTDALAWIAFAILVAVAVLGWTMFALWYQRRQSGAADATLGTGTPAEQRFPVPIVGLHGLLAVITVVLVFLAAVGV
jgi:manganese efflux pump family protein